jgi:hypothetical protein
MEKIVSLVIAFGLCCVPTCAHVWDDRYGDNKKLNDVFALIVLAFILGLISAYLLPIVSVLPPVPLIKTLPLNFGIHTLVFDYWINYELYKNKVIEREGADKWFVYLGLSAKLDKYHLWVKIGRWGRLAVRLIVFLTSLIWFLL